MRAIHEEKKTTALLGLAFNHDDGHTRITRGNNFLLWGGSQDTHSLMQETAVKITEQLDKSGKRLEDVSINELRDICLEVTKSPRRS